MNVFSHAWWRCLTAVWIGGLIRLQPGSDFTSKDLAEQAVGDADALLQKLRIEPGQGRHPKPLTESQKRIHLVRSIFADFEEEPPRPAVIGKWIQRIGGIERLTDLLERLGEAGLLGKGHAYIFGAIKRQAEHHPPPGQKLVLRPDRYPDGFMLPTRARWCPELLKFLPEKEWLALRELPQVPAEAASS